MLAIVNFTLLGDGYFYIPINIFEIFEGDAVKFLGNTLIMLGLCGYDFLGRSGAQLSLELIIPSYRRKTSRSTLPGAP